MRRPPRMLLAAGAVLVLLLAAPLVLPTRLIVERIELAAGARLDEQVRIDSASIHVLPRPRLVLSGLAVGKRPHLRIETITVTPRLLSLLRGQNVIDLVELDGPRLSQVTLERLGQWSAGAGGTDGPSVRVERLRVRQLELRTEALKLANVSGDVRLSADGRLLSAVLEADGGRLQITLTPRGHAMRIRLAAKDWRLPLKPHLHFTSLRAIGVLSAHALDLSEVKGSLYGGRLAGRIRFDWRPRWMLAGRAELENMQVEPLARMYSTGSSISGRLDAVSVFEGGGASPTELADSMRFEARFELHDGLLHKMDLAAAATLVPGKASLKAGVTRFDRFRGHLGADRKGFYFSDLGISSGALDAKGNLTVTGEEALSGRIDVALKGTGSIVGTPLAVSGTVDAPRLRPTGGTVAGAAAGTLLLGPGLGTTLGMKAGQLTERLFGRKDVARAPANAAQPATEKSARSGPTGGR